jgi:hypothetical protein
MGEAVIVAELQKVSPIGDTLPLPVNEGQARELVTVPREKRAEVLKRAAGKAGKRSLNARIIREAKSELIDATDTKGNGKAHKAPKRISVETKVFLSWIKDLKEKIGKNQQEEALRVLTTASPPPGLGTDLRTERVPAPPTRQESLFRVRVRGNPRCLVKESIERDDVSVLLS